MILQSEETVFEPSSDLTIRAIGSLHGELTDLIRDSATTKISLPDQYTADLSFVQLIEAARLYARKNGKRLELSNPASGPLLDVLQRGGILEEMTADDKQFWFHQGEVQ